MIGTPPGSRRVEVTRRVMDKENYTNLLTETWLAVLALSTMNECGGLVVEAVQPIGVFVDKRVVLRNELPANFGGIDGGGAVGHDGTAKRFYVSDKQHFKAIKHTVRAEDEDRRGK